MSHKKKKATAQFLVGSLGVSSVASQSRDGLRVKRKRTVANSAAAGPSTTEVFNYWEEDLTTNAAMGAEDFSWGLGDDSLDAQPDEEDVQGIQVVVGPPRNKNSVSAVCLWKLG
jgi:hypothetical protein